MLFTCAVYSKFCRISPDSEQAVVDEDADQDIETEPSEVEMSETSEKEAVQLAQHEEESRVRGVFCVIALTSDFL